MLRSLLCSIWWKIHFLSCYKGVPRGLKVIASTQDKHVNNKCTQSALQAHTFTDNHITWDTLRLHGFQQIKRSIISINNTPPHTVLLWRKWVGFCSVFMYFPQSEFNQFLSDSKKGKSCSHMVVTERKAVNLPQKTRGEILLICFLL